MRQSLPDPVRGALWMMGSMASWACMAAVARYFTGEIHTFEIVFFRSVFGCIFLLPWLFKVGLGGLKTQRVGMHLVRGFIGLAVIYLLFTAIALATLGEVAAIMSTRPMVASLGAILILHEAAHGRRWAATIIGFLGALLIIRPGVEEISTGVILAFLAVIGMAALTVVMKSLARTERPDTIVVWQMMVFTPCALIPALFVWQTPDPLQFVLLASTGLFGTFTQRCLTRAYAAADATVVVPFDFTRLIFSAILGLILFQEFPDIWVWIGGVIILCGVLWMTHLEAKEARS
ncbi:MAG: DMT family transporter [Rhodospirillaceae bacterium]|nr:DMT family transporter [Rhodospirillaceae bacterium]MBT5458856.1 DMT family transporter [Rhodospirillaceae bacterium]